MTEKTQQELAEEEAVEAAKRRSQAMLSGRQTAPLRAEKPEVDRVSNRAIDPAEQNRERDDEEAEKRRERDDEQVARDEAEKKKRGRDDRLDDSLKSRFEVAVDDRPQPGVHLRPPMSQSDAEQAQKESRVSEAEVDRRQEWARQESARASAAETERERELKRSGR